MIVIESKEQFIDLVREAVREEMKAQEPPKEPETITVEQAAAVCDVNPQTVRNWINHGVVKNRGTVGRKLVRVDDIQKFIKKKSADESP